MVTLESLNLQRKNDTKEITIGAGTVVVNQYVTIADVNDLILTALAASKVNGTYNEVLLDMNFFYGIVKYYTDIDVTDITVNEVYDILHSNNAADDILAALPQGTYDRLYDYLMTVKFAFEKDASNVVKHLQEFINKLPQQIATINTAMDSFNLEDYENVIDFVRAANAGQPLDVAEDINNVPEMTE